MYVDEVAEFTYEANESVTAYLEVNGRIPWSGRVGFEGTALPADESNITINDGTGRGTITFEFDSDGSAKETSISAAESIVNTGTGNLTSWGTYLGVDSREYVVEIDSNGTPDTFRWSSNGGLSFNDSGIAIVADTNYTLSAGVLVEFNSTNAYELGDRWRIKVGPSNEIVEVGRYGTFADQLATTQSNLIKAINRARNEGKLSVYARDITDGAASGFPMQNLGEHQIELIHEGAYSIHESVDIHVTSNPALVSEDLNVTVSPVAGSTGTITLDLGRLAGLSEVLEVRLVTVDTDGNRGIPSPRYYEVRDRNRPYVEMMHPTEDRQAGRRAVLRIAEVNATGGISKLEVLDPGYGYEYNFNDGADNNLTTFRFISAHGAGATLKVGLEENGTLALNGARYITSGLGDDYNLSGGSGYDLNDVLVAPAALLYELEETLMLRVRLHDPMNEVSQLKFYGNGVELDGISTTASGQTTMVFMPESEALSFVTARALYGDERDNPPAVMPVAGSSTILRSTERGEVATTRWGWNRNWQQQHMYDGNYPAPSWFWSGVNGYWSWPPEWLNLPDMPGALSAQSTASLLEEVDDNFSASMAFKFPAEDNSPEFSVGAEIPSLWK